MVADTALSADDKAMLAAKLNDAAGQLDHQIETAPTAGDALALDEKATALRNQATQLIAAAIVLRQNDAGLDAAHLAYAVDHCNQVIARVAAVKKAIQVAAALLTFISVLMTGNVPDIVKAGVTLDKRLTAIEKGAE